MRGFWLGVVLLAASTAAASTAWAQEGDAGAGDAGSVAALPLEPGAKVEPALPGEPMPLAPMASTQLGGYGEITYNRPSAGDPILDLRRFVLFVGHSFDAHWRMYSELEIEHAVASSDDQGECEIEQAYLDYVHTEALNVRAGVVLLPVGIINQQHEPPTFNGVDRPLVDTLVIPTTWREPGIGLWGRLGEDVRYQLYLVDGMRAIGFGADGIREGHQEAQLAEARSGAVVGRLDWEPLTMLDVGASGYYGSANQGELPDGAGKLLLGEVDARLEHRGFEARAEAALLHVSGTEFMATDEGAAPVGSLQYGLYLQAGYDLMHVVRPGSSARLVLYGMFQRADTNQEVAPGRLPDDALQVESLEAGLTWRPIPELVGKLDVNRELHPLVDGQDLTWLDLGIGWMF